MNRYATRQPNGISALTVRRALVVDAGNVIVQGSGPLVQLRTPVNNTLSRGTGQAGRCLNTDLGANDLCVFSNTSIDIGTGDFTLCVFMTLKATLIAGCYATGVNAGYFSFSPRVQSAGDNAAMVLAAATINSGIPMSAPGTYRVVVVRRSGFLYFFINGAKSGPIAAAQVVQAFTQVNLNGASTTFGYGVPNADYYLYVLDTRSWADGLILDWIANPWSIFSARYTRLWSPISAVAGLPNLTSAQGFNIGSTGFQPQVTGTWP